MTNNEFIKICKEELIKHFNERKDITDKFILSTDEIFVVWFCKTLQNHKALLSTTASDGMYYEFTFNGDKSELYMDVYKKQKNKCIKIGTVNK